MGAPLCRRHGSAGRWVGRDQRSAACGLRRNNLRALIQGHHGQSPASSPVHVHALINRTQSCPPSYDSRSIGCSPFVRGTFPSNCLSPRIFRHIALLHFPTLKLRGVASLPRPTPASSNPSVRWMDVRPTPGGSGCPVQGCLTDHHAAAHLLSSLTYEQPVCALFLARSVSPEPRSR